jgi:putative ABC transport system permease protein
MTGSPMIRLLFASLLYHARENFAVALGSAVGAAVLTGALLVGDSLRGSLRERAERQLNGIDYALVGGRFFRASLADELPGSVRPVLLLQGTVSAGDQRVGKVTVLGIDDRMGLEAAMPHDRSVTINPALAAALRVQPGQEIRLTVQKASAIPRSTALAKRDIQSTTRTASYTVGTILPQGHPAAEFTLNPGPADPLVLYVSLATLQKEIAQPDRANALLSTAQPLEPLQQALASQVTLEDWGIKVQIPPKRKAYISVESRNLLLEPMMVSPTILASMEARYHAAPTFVYLANTIAAKGQEIPYSVVAGIDPQDATDLNPVKIPFADDEIVLVDWKDSPLKVKPGDTITLSYFKPEIEGRIEEATKSFKLKAIIPLEGAAADPDLVPEFPGITDQLEISKWDPPFPYDNKRIKPRDERYWREHRTTPKAYISLTAAHALWGSRFGETTSIRLIPRQGELDLPLIRKKLIKTLNPEWGGFTFQPIRQKLMEAGQGSTDFGMLFVAFSFFLILAALMLVSLLSRLNLERRVKQFGLLRATGYPLKKVRRMLLLEGLIVAVVGSAVGLLAAWLYADLMLRLLTSLWPSPSLRNFLTLHWTPQTLLIGFFGSVVMSLLAIWWAIRGLSKIAPSNLLKGVVEDPTPSSNGTFGALIVAGLGIVGTAILMALAPQLPPGEPQSGAFFGSGAMLLMAGLALIWAWLKKPRHSEVRSLIPLGVRQAVRHPLRSLLTTGLIASATFLLVAVESFRREPSSDFLNKKGGSGGFSYLAESDIPLFLNLNSEEGRNEMLDVLQRQYQSEGKTGQEVESQLQQAEEALKGCTVYPFRVKTGDDASCLNLYQSIQPRILGVPEQVIERGGFQFSASLAESPAEQENPWKILDRWSNNVIPCFVEENTAMWQLKKGLGDTLEIPNEQGSKTTVVIAGLLKDSVFQSEVLIGDRSFRSAFPRHEGFSYFLLDTPPDSKAPNLLAQGLVSYGFEPSTTISRVRTYLAVQNTYLTTFQLLGGFGLLLGVLGLAIVLLRNVWERRAELSVLRAMGYRLQSLQKLIFAENALLLALGLGVGLIAAIVSVLPHLASGGQIPALRLIVLIGGVVVVAVATAALAVLRSVRMPVVTGLRNE